MGYGGSCFPKDVRALINTAKEKGYSADLLKEVDQLNERQKLVLLSKIKNFYSDLKGKTLTIWGLSFKPKTSDMREAPSINLINHLLNLGVIIKAYDPVALEEAKMFLGNNIQYCNSLTDSVLGSNGIILITEWDDFRNVNFAELGKIMKQKVVFDGRNIYEPEMLIEEGFEYYGIGRR